ncbi:MAG: polyphosphate kinase 1 [Spirochaetaceae bacterium]|jgi:polyphosphate kinase|nr:polyphosphate kinase 1 [Spirochaetaceae bacterium]
MIRFFNRELSWLEFNYRVLREGFRRDLPVMERLRFLGIAGENFDEFCMVRLAALKQQCRLDSGVTDSAGISAGEQLRCVFPRFHELAGLADQCLTNDVFPLLAAFGQRYAPPADWTESQRAAAAVHFDSEVFPLLTPLRIDGPELPPLPAQSIHAAFALRLMPGIANPLFREYPSADGGHPGDDTGELFDLPVYAAVRVPAVSRLVRLPAESGGECFALLEDVITVFGTRLFPGYSVEESMVFRLIRDAEMPVDEDSGEAFLFAMSEVLVERERSVPVCLWCNGASPRIREFLRTRLALEEREVVTVRGALDPSTLQDLGVSGEGGLVKWKHVYPQSLTQGLAVGAPKGEPLWDTIKERDVLIHVPYESYEPVLGFIHDAARDRNVLAIKMTLYRTSGNPPIIDSLVTAAQTGKQVTVFVEIKARFDERRNIAWVERLERAGVIVIFGIVKLKVHAKLLLVIRRESDGIRRYVHFSTGNYNEKTARRYSDLSILTADEQITTDATLFFNIISGYSALQTMHTLRMAPVNMRSHLISLIDREIASSTADSPGLIMAKMNALTDEELIGRLYRANQAGVTVRLNVRGVCMLVPGAAGLSDHISVISIVDHYLEHSRIYYFKNSGDEELFLGSADWMPRNLDRRIELMFPVRQKDIFGRLKDQLLLYLGDNRKSYRLQTDGSWTQQWPAEDADVVWAQRTLQDQAEQAAAANGGMDFTVRRRG